MIKLSHPLVPAPPRGPFQNVTDGLLGRQHKSPEEAANLGDAQRAPPLRAALNAARLCNGTWSNIFLGSALSFLYSFQVYQRRFVAPGTGASGKASPRAARYLVVLLAALVVLVGLWPQPLVLLCRAAAAALTGGPG